jgi:hypothetical protein
MTQGEKMQEQMRLGMRQLAQNAIKRKRVTYSAASQVMSKESWLRKFEAGSRSAERARREPLNYGVTAKSEFRRFKAVQLEDDPSSILDLPPLKEDDEDEIKVETSLVPSTPYLGIGLHIHLK